MDIAFWYSLASYFVTFNVTFILKKPTVKLSGRDAVIRCQNRRRRRVGSTGCLRASAMVLTEMFEGIVI